MTKKIEDEKGLLFENYMKSTSIYLDMYMSWLAALEKMGDKTEELSKEASDPRTAKEFYDLWVKMYEMAFEDMPGPMKEMMEPVKIMGRMYADTFTGIWGRTGIRTASAYPGKYR